jgi:uncharacterized protein
MNTANPIFRHYLDWSQQGRSSVWLYLIAIVIAYLGLQWGSIPTMILAGSYINDPLIGPLVLELSFVGLIVSVLLATKFVLGRPSWSVAIPALPPRWRDYALGMLIWCSGMLLMYLLFVVPYGRITFQGWSGFGTAIIPIIFAIILTVMVQTAAEELFFRGLVMQATRRVTRWIFVQALWFAQLHAGNVSAWGGGYLAMTPYFATAVTLGYSAWRSGSIIMPMGMHFANNIVLFLLVRTDDDVTLLATPFVAQTPEPWRAISEAIGQALFVIIVLEYLARRRKSPL